MNIPIWSDVIINDVVLDMQTGFASGQRDESGILQLRMNNITTDGRVLLDSYLKVPIPQDINKYLLKSGDILFNNTNSVDLIGKTALFKNECKNCTFSNHITRIRVDENKIVTEWLLYHLVKLRQSGYFSQICARHVGQAGIRNDQVLKIQIPLPPLPEQRRIATILTTVDDAIQRSRQVAAETERLKAGVMQDLMTKGIGHTEFREDPDVGMVPKEWDVSSLSDLSEQITVGIVVKPADHYVPHGVPAFRSLNILRDKIKTDDFVFISKTENDTILSKSKIYCGDILVVRTGYPGTACVVPKEFDGCNCIDLIIVRPKTSVILSEYLSRYINRTYAVESDFIRETTAITLDKKETNQNEGEAIKREVADR